MYIFSTSVCIIHIDQSICPFLFADKMSYSLVKVVRQLLPCHLLDQITGQCLVDVFLPGFKCCWELFPKGCVILASSEPQSFTISPIDSSAVVLFTNDICYNNLATLFGGCLLHCELSGKLVNWILARIHFICQFKITDS